MITGHAGKDEILVNGYVRELFQSEEFKESEINEPSSNIIKVIEMLHSFSYDEWKMYISLH